MMALERILTERYPWIEQYLRKKNEDHNTTEKLFYYFAWRDAERSFDRNIQALCYQKLVSFSVNHPISMMDKIRIKMGATPSFFSTIAETNRHTPSYQELFQRFASSVMWQELSAWSARICPSEEKESAVSDSDFQSDMNQDNRYTARQFLLNHLALLNQLRLEKSEDDRTLNKKVENVNYYFLELYYKRLDDFALAYGFGRVADYAQEQHLAKTHRDHANKKDQDPKLGYTINESDHFALVDDDSHDHYVRKRKRYIRWGRFIALLVAIGCGFISAHATVSFALPWVLLFACAGFMTNLFLYTNSIVIIVKNLFIRKHRLHHGIDGKLSWPRLRKALINLSFAFALGAGIAFFALTWNSILESLSFLGNILSVMHAPVLLVTGVPFVFTFFISSAMLVGLTSIMFNSAATLLKSDMNHIKQKLREWFYPDVGMRKFSLAHVAKIGIVLMFLGIGFFVGSLAAVALCGVMQENIALLLVSNAGLSSGAAFWISNFIAWTMNGVLRFTFSIKANMTFWSMCGSKIKELLIYPRESWAAIKNYYQFVSRSKWSVLFELFKIKMGFIVLINGGSQGYLSVHGQGPAVIQRATGLDTDAAKKTAFITGAGSSTSINMKSTLDEYQAKEKHEWEHFNTHVFRDASKLTDTTYDRLQMLLTSGLEGSAAESAPLSPMMRDLSVGSFLGTSGLNTPTSHNDSQGDSLDLRKAAAAAAAQAAADQMIDSGKKPVF